MVWRVQDGFPHTSGALLRVVGRGLFRMVSSGLLVFMQVFQETESGKQCSVKA